MKVAARFAIFLMFGFCSMLFFDFAYHLDLGFWAYGTPGKDHHMFWETGHLVLFFRPLGAVLLNILGWSLRVFRGIETLTYARFLTLILFAGFGAYLFYWIRTKLNRPTWEAWILCAFTFLHPTWWIATMFITTSVPTLWAPMMGLFAGVLFLNQGRYALALSGSLILASFYTYPLGSVAGYWPFLLTFALTNKVDVRQVIKFTALFGAVCLFGLLIHRPIIQPIMCEPGPLRIWCSTWSDADSKQYSIQIVSDLPHKFSVIRDMLRTGFGSWTIPQIGLDAFPSFLVLIIWGTAFFSGLSWRKLLTSVGVGAFIVLVFCAPNLVTRGDVVAFRTAAPITLILGIAVVKALRLFTKMNLKAAVLISLIPFLSSAYFGAQFAKRYQYGWEILKASPGLAEICVEGESKQKIFDAFYPQKDAGEMAVLVHKSERKEMDLGLAVFASWVYRGVCHILAEPGSPFERSAPGL